MNNLDQFRQEKDTFFKSHPQSPLTSEQKASFNGLSYFPPETGLRFETEIEEFELQEQIEMQTSTGDIQVYTRYGRFKFTVEDQEAELTIYASHHGFFLPFIDSLAGEETYGAGRYLEPEVLPDGNFLIDFNLAYNPYCAYNEFYSCPLTPWENRLQVAIRAGEKLPAGEWVLHI